MIGRGCADSRPQREYITKEESTSSSPLKLLLTSGNKKYLCNCQNFKKTLKKFKTM